MGVKKQIHFKDEDRDVLEHVKRQPNGSQYLIRLAREDMQGRKRLTEQDVIELIERHAGAGEIGSGPAGIKNTGTDTGISDSIKSLLEW